MASPSKPQEPLDHLRLALVLGAAVAVSPLAMDAYLPAFPAIAQTLGVPHHLVELSLSIYLAGLAGGHFLGGPLSDRYGRAPVMLGGLTLFGAASLMIAVSATFGQLMGWRLLQAVGAGFCVVSVPAIARDHTRGAEAARLFSLIGLVIFVAPAAAPSLGTLLLWLSGWPAIFVFLAGYAALLIAVLRLTLFTGPRPSRPEREPVRTLLTHYGQVLRSAAAMRLLGVQALVFSVMMVFITHASAIFQRGYGLSEGAFSAIMAGSVAVMALFNLGNRGLLRRWDPDPILRGTVALQAATLLALFLLTLADPPLILFLPVLLLGIGTFGAAMPNTFATYLEHFPHISATAAALMGGLRFTVSGGISGISAWLADGRLWPVAAMMAGCSLGALLLTGARGGAGEPS